MQTINTTNHIETFSEIPQPIDLEIGQREELMRTANQRLGVNEDDEEADYKNLPAAWKRHSIVAGFGAAAVYFSTMPSQALTSLLFTLGFLRLSKSYMIGFPRFRRYCVLAAAVGGAAGLQYLWKGVNLTPLAAGLGIDALTFTSKAYMKGKLKKDEGPKESNGALLCLESAVNKGCDLVDGTLSKISSCFGALRKRLLTK